MIMLQILLAVTIIVMLGFIIWYMKETTYYQIVGDELKELVKSGVIEGVWADAIKETSIDVNLDEVFNYEVRPEDDYKQFGNRHEVSPGKEVLATATWNLRSGGFRLKPGDFILGHLCQVITLPNDISAYFYLKSDVARVGLQHSIAIGIKPGWTGKLQLELSNTTKYHDIILTHGLFVGTIQFYRHKKVKPYSGKYQNQELS